MKKKALLINDSKFESLILRDLLNQLNYDVELADEYDAMYEVEQFTPDVVIVNYIMQDTTGDKLIQHIKKGKPLTKCLLSSSSPVKLSDFENHIIDGVLRTPVSLFTLKDVLHRVGEVRMDANYYMTGLDNKPILRSSKRYCESCNQEITTFGENIVFCPYCGDEIQY